MKLKEYYKIYCGEGFKKLIALYSLLVFAIVSYEAVAIILIRSFSIKSSLLTGSMSAFYSINIFSQMKRSRNRQDRYLLTVKDSFKAYRAFYVVSNIASFMAFFLIISFMFFMGGMMNVLPENAVLLFVYDIESLILIYGLIPFIVFSKKISSGVIEIVFLNFLFALRNIVLSPKIVFVVFFGIISILLVILSNRIMLGERNEK